MTEEMQKQIEENAEIMTECFGKAVKMGKYDADAARGAIALFRSVVLSAGQKAATKRAEDLLAVALKLVKELKPSEIHSVAPESAIPMPAACYFCDGLGDLHAVSIGGRPRVVCALCRDLVLSGSAEVVYKREEAATSETSHDTEWIRGDAVYYADTAAFIHHEWEKGNFHALPEVRVDHFDRFMGEGLVVLATRTPIIKDMMRKTHQEATRDLQLVLTRLIEEQREYMWCLAARQTSAYQLLKAREEAETERMEHEERMAKAEADRVEREEAEGAMKAVPENQAPSETLIWTLTGQECFRCLAQDVKTVLITCGAEEDTLVLALCEKCLDEIGKSPGRSMPGPPPDPPPVPPEWGTAGPGKCSFCGNIRKVHHVRFGDDSRLMCVPCQDRFNDGTLGGQDAL